MRSEHGLHQAGHLPGQHPLDAVALHNMPFVSKQGHRWAACLPANSGTSAVKQPLASTGQGGRPPTSRMPAAAGSFLRVSWHPERGLQGCSRQRWGLGGRVKPLDPAAGGRCQGSGAPCTVPIVRDVQLAGPCWARPRRSWSMSAGSAVQLAAASSVWCTSAWCTCAGAGGGLSRGLALMHISGAASTVEGSG